MKKQVLWAVILADFSFSLMGYSGASIIGVPPGPTWEQGNETPFEVPSAIKPNHPGGFDESLKRKSFVAGPDNSLLREDHLVWIALDATMYDLSIAPLSLGETEELKLFSHGRVLFNDHGGLRPWMIPKPIPEISTAFLIGCGILGLYGLRRVSVSTIKRIGRTRSPFHPGIDK